MQYQEYDYVEDTDEAPWTAAPVVSAPVIAGNSQLMPLTPNPLTPSTQTPVVVSENAALGSLLQSVQQTQAQQMYLLRNLDARLARLEQARRADLRAQAQAQTSNTASFERATWWAIWGLLMLVLGSALAVVMLLIVLNLQFR